MGSHPDNHMEPDYVSFFAVSGYTIVKQNVLPKGVDPAGRPSLASYSLGTRPYTGNLT